MNKRFALTILVLAGFITLTLIVLRVLGIFPPFTNTFSSVDNNSHIGEFKIEAIATDLNVPWAIVFLDENRIMFTERPGRVRLIKNGQLQPGPVLEFDRGNSSGEAGVMGMVLHPRFEETHFVYICHSYKKEGQWRLKVVRYQEKDSTLLHPLDMIEDIPAAEIHAGCELAFGPNEKLYITVGDAADKNLAQALGSLAGKILRINADGTIPPENPFYNRPGARKEIYSYGHRNPQGISWDLENNILYQAEHGPSGFDGPGGYDEVNIIKSGHNYGWPLILGDEKRDGMETPIKYYTPAFAPGSVQLYSADMISEIKGTLLVAGLRGSSILSLKIEKGQLKSQSVLIDDKYGRIREVIQAPDGSIYFTTSNRDGRGSLLQGDDHIYRIYR